MNAKIRVLVLVSCMLAIFTKACFSTSKQSVSSPYVVFLGTGAADIDTPKVDNCEFCTYIRKHGGKNWRRFSSLYISPNIVIDFSTTGMESLSNANIRPGDIGYLLITHSHGDHCNPSSIVTLAKSSWELSGRKLQVFCNSKVGQIIRGYVDGLREGVPIDVKEIKPYQEFQVGEWSCIALAGNHAADEDCLLYLFQKEGYGIFYATDTTWFPVRTFQEVANRKLNLVVVEATFGPKTDAELLIGHMNFDFARKIKEYLVKKRCLDPYGVFALTHLSLHHCPPYGLLHGKMAAEGILIPYDGQKLLLRSR